MASTKISALPGASTLTGAETIPLVQGGTTKKVTTDQFLTKDASGNVGLGVTPSAWTMKALDVSNSGSFYGDGVVSSWVAGISQNAYFDGAWKYRHDGHTAERYEIGAGHKWYTAPGGTAGNAISFTQAMTLDASGDLTTANGRINLITVGRGGGGVASNTASGVSALQSNTTGGYNTASGLEALYSNTTGYCNTASGGSALYSNTTGYYNTASGLNALYSNTTGSNNTASGLNALCYNTTGVSNTASGHQALYYNTTGYNNTASGRSGYNPDNDIAQYRITSDFDMTLVGYGATKDNAGQLWNSTAIGARAKVTKSNQVVLGDSNVTETLINGDLLVGTTSGYTAKTNIFSTADGIHIGVSAGSSAITSFLAGWHSSTSTSRGTLAFNITSNGDITNLNNSYGAISDEKLKENITDASPKLAKLMQVRIVNYTLKSDPDKTKLIGVVAQELEKVSPGLIEETADRDAEGNDLGTTTKSVKYSVFVPMLIKSLQEQQAQIEALEARLAAAGI